jgi:hypothetical protein
MQYTKPQIVAQNSAQGTFAAGCPVENSLNDCFYPCKLSN